MNIKEIAKLAGVSPSTVSKIMNNKDKSISQETRERVLKIVNEYHYSPYASATSAPQKAWVIGILLRYPISFDMTLNGIIKTAQKNGYYTMVCNSYDDNEQEYKNIAALCRNRADGIIWEPVNQKSLSLSQYISDQNIPFFTIGSICSNSSFQLPYQQFGYKITEELIIRGHKKIACLLTEGRRQQSFLNGYKQCLFKNELSLDESLIFEDLNHTIIEKINTMQITAIVCSHYRKALEFHQMMCTLHYKIPEQLSLISLKNDKTEAFSYPEISTYTVSSENFGSFLCQQIIASIEKLSEKLQEFFQEFKLDNQATIAPPYDKNRKKIIVVGSINMDTYLNVSILPDTGKTVTTPISHVYSGGKGINQAIGVAKLGHSVSLIGNVGSDSDADHIYRTLTEYSVDTSGIKRCFEKNTGKAYIFLDSKGNSMISILTGANAIFSPDDILQNEHLFEDTGYCLVQTEIPIETVIQSCKIAKKYNAKTILKPSACNNISKELFSYVDILIPNEEELNDLCPEFKTLEEKAMHLISYGIDSVIVTMGENGCYLFTTNTKKHFPVANFTTVDTTGASDAFISALACYLLYGYDIDKAISIATYASGFCISREGVVPALIDKASLESYINQTNPSLLQI